MNIDLNKWSPATVMVVIGFVFLLLFLLSVIKVIALSSVIGSAIEHIPN